MTISTVSFAYPEVDDVRRAAILGRLRLNPSPPGLFVLSTCLRLELACSGSPLDLRQLIGTIGGGEDIVGLGETRSGEQALEHLFRVATGLESPIVGEREVLTQFRQALAEQENLGSVFGPLAKALEAAVAVARQARTLLPESPHDSMAAVAAQIAGSVDRVAVLGSGQMGTAVVNALGSLPAPPEVLVLSRRQASVLSAGVEVAGFEALHDVLRHHPAVISATSARESLVGAGDLDTMVADRTEPLLLIDMAMPPDFGDFGSDRIRYHGIDDLARMVRRKGGHHEADELVATAARETHHRLENHHEVGPVIGDLLRVAESVAARVTERFSGRLTHPNDREILAQASRTVARTLLASPVNYLNSPDRADGAVEILSEAFELDHA